MALLHLRIFRHSACIALLALTVSLVACKRAVIGPFRDGPRTQYRLTIDDVKSLENYRAEQASLTRLSGQARGTWYQNGKKRPFKQVFALQVPDSIRIEIKNSVSQTLALFIARDQELYYREKGSEPYLASPADAFHVRSTLGYALEIPDLIRALLARLEECGEEPGRSFPRSGALVFFESRAIDGRTEYGFDLQAGVLRSIDHTDATSGRVLVRFESYTRVDGELLPSEIWIRNPESQETLELRIVRYTVEPTFGKDVFRFPG